MGRMSNQGASSSNRYAKIVDALNESVEIFTAYSEEAFDDVMSNGLRPMADAVGLDRIVIYKWLEKEGRLIQKYVWAHGRTSELVEALQRPSGSSAVSRWLGVLKKGECINGRVEDMPEDEAAFLRTYDVKSIYFVPVFTHGKFWGLVTLEDLTHSRYFEEESIKLLGSAARLCASAYIREEIERKAVELEGLTHSITNASPFPYILFDKDFYVLDCNKAALRIFGCSDKRYLAEHYWDRFSPPCQPDGQDSFTKAKAYADKTLEAGKRQFYEWEHLSMDGKPLPMENTLTPIVHEGEQFIVSFKYDLRDTRKLMGDIQRQGGLLEMRLQQQELSGEILKNLVSSGELEMLIQDAIAKLGRYLGASRALVFKVDYEDGESFLAYRWYELGTVPPMPAFPGMLEIIRSSFVEDLEDDASISVAYCDDVTEDSRYKALELVDVKAFVGAPLYVEGHFWGVLCLEQCDAPRQWKKNEITFISKISSILAGAITRSIYNEKLEKALASMTAASEAKGLFLSNMSHEMRTPLNTIMGMATIGKNSPEIGRKEYALSKIEEASSHLLGVINDVLDMSKIEANKLELVVSDFSFEKTMKKAVNAVLFRMEQKQQVLGVNVSGKIPHILEGDDQRLAQVLINLLSNAVKFTPEGGNVYLNAHLVKEVGEICTIGVEVVDTGIGISPEDQGRLFHAFEQADRGISRKFGGTGLGLVISKRIIEQMGGTIEVESTLGKGSKFSLQFEAARGKDNPASLLDSSVNWETMEVLAVDDANEILEYFVEIFKRYGVTCNVASSGEAALKMMEQNGGYDVYFVDWKMPGMDGIELTKEIKARSLERNKKSVVIMISATEWSLIRDEAEDVGIDKYLMKPLFASDIMDCMNACLGAHDADAPRRHKVVVAGEFKGCHILLAEDVEINREIVLSLMEETQAEIDCAENGVEALRLMEENPGRYHLVFMDVQMPEMDGLEATRRIRTMSHDNGVPIVAMTANVFKEDIEKCLAAGMDDHIGKPLDIGDVLKKVRRYWKPTIRS